MSCLDVGKKLFLNYQHGSPYFASFAASHESETFGGGRFYAYPRGIHFEDFCKTLSHLGYVPGKFRLLQRNGDVGIAYPESVFFYKSHYSGEQNLAVYSFEFVRIVRKVLPDVSQCQGTQTGIAQRVYGNISVRMGYKAILRVNFDTA